MRTLSDLDLSVAGIVPNSNCDFVLSFLRWLGTEAWTGEDADWIEIYETLILPEATASQYLRISVDREPELPVFRTTIPDRCNEPPPVRLIEYCLNIL